MQALPLLTAMQMPDRTPQLHFAPVPAWTSSDPWQLISLFL
jgi:hypothetical protein